MYSWRGVNKTVEGSGRGDEEIAVTGSNGIGFGSVAEGAGGAGWKSHCKKKNSWAVLSPADGSWDSWLDSLGTGTTKTGCCFATRTIALYESKEREAQM